MAYELASILCHVRTALSAIDPSRLPVCVHGTSCRSVYVTLGYCWLLLMPTWRHTYFPQCLRPRHICDIYDLFALHINVLTDLLTSSLIHWYMNKPLSVIIRLVPDFGSNSGKSEMRPFFRNPTKSGSPPISIWIWWMSVQLQYLQLITDKTNSADLSSRVFLISLDQVMLF